MRWKIPVSDGLSEKDLKRTEELNIQKLRFLYKEKPFVTALYLANKSGLTLDFVNKHWHKIIA